MKQTARKQNTKIQNEILSKRENVKGTEEALEDRKKLENFKVEDNVNNRMDLFLFSKQVDSLFNSINEFEPCFPEVEFKEAVGAK